MHHNPESFGENFQELHLFLTFIHLIAQAGVKEKELVIHGSI
jgi:hypothetical protein